MLALVFYGNWKALKNWSFILLHESAVVINWQQLEVTQSVTSSSFQLIARQSFIYFFSHENIIVTLIKYILNFSYNAVNVLYSGFKRQMNAT